MNTSGDRLKALLRECNLTASDFAAQRGVTPQHVNNWFQRGVPMAYSTVYRMLQTLSYAGLLLPAGTHGRHPCYRPSSAVLNAWQARPSPVSGVGLSGPTSPSA